MIAAFSGVLFAFYLQYLDPNLFGWTRSSEWVIFLFFGGTNSLTGSVISTIFLTLMPEALRFASELRIVMYTLIIIFVLNFRPQGLLGDKELTGKTTILNLLSKVYTPDSGRIFLGGSDVSDYSQEQVSIAGISRTFQNIRLFEGLNVLQNVKVVQYIGGYSFITRTI